MYKLTIHKKDGMNDPFAFPDMFELLMFLNTYIADTILEKNYMECEFTISQHDTIIMPVDTVWISGKLNL